MGLAAKILAAANILAAFVLFYFVGKDFAVRQNWMQLIEKRIADRDGYDAKTIVDNYASARDAAAHIEGLSETEKEYVDLRLKEWENLKSDYAKRKAAAEFMLEKVPHQPESIPNQDNQKVAAELGWDDYRKILREFRMMHAPQLQHEEMLLLAKKDALLQAQKGYDEHIRDLKAKIAELGKDQKPEEIIEAEKGIKRKLDEENDMRRKELAGLYTELEEQLAARNVSQGRERDMRDLLELTRKQIQLLTKENQELAGQISKKEGVDLNQKQLGQKR